MGEDKEMFEKLSEMIQVYVEADQITPESKFIEDLGFNSYDFMCLVGDIEDEFEVEVNEGDVKDIVTVADAVKYIEALKND